MRSIRLLLMTLVVVGALAFAGIGGTFATWSDSETSYDNYIETGSLDLKVNGQDDGPWGSGVGPVSEIADAVKCSWYDYTVELWNAGDVDAVAYLEIKNLDGPDCLVEFTDVRVWYDDGLVESGTVSELAGEEIELGDLPAGATEEVKIELHATEGSCCGARFDYDLQFDVLGSWADSETSRGNYFELDCSWEGCSHGFWKKHEDAWKVTGYNTTADFDSTFGCDAFACDKTLMGALGLGGGELSALAREAVAALLNAAHPGVDYPLTPGEVIQKVQQAIVAEVYESTKDELEGHNAHGLGGCPLD